MDDSDEYDDEEGSAGPDLFLEGDGDAYDDIDYEPDIEIADDEDDVDYEYSEIDASYDDEDEDEDDDELLDFRRARGWFPAETVEPQPIGVELLQGGEFGRVGIFSNIQQRRTSLHSVLERRKMSVRMTPKECVVRPLVPNSYGSVVATHTSNIYAGQYSADSSFFYTCSQDFRLHVYDTTSSSKLQPKGSSGNLRSGLYQTTMKVMKTIRGVTGNWTITDSHLSPDNERIIYATITPTVHMAKTTDSDEEQVPIDFADNRSVYDSRFGIWSCRFSADGNEIIAGGKRHIFVYDLLAMRRSVKIVAHQDDVNSCCWADPASGNVLISASDDSFLKIWDRRSLGSSAKPAGVLVGHTEGITHVSSKGDGRYVISNGKDQTLRLWDIRKMMSSQDFSSLPNASYRIPHYDYRHSLFPEPLYKAHPNDNSVMKFTGHAVYRTLIRCYFSPTETTGGSYIYSGSSDGKIHVWSLDGRIVQVINRAHTLPISFDPSDENPSPDRYKGPHYRLACVRDVSWHSREPVLMSCAWDDYSEYSTVARHEWKGFGKNGMTLEDVVEREIQSS
ncbi:hypothetical protein BOTBODRAFT_27695 [Botryobasidium botryosum FD-172 SS1]|uniref:Uncharacterized protein n=1 Tax=Botryobasidium botryosum (strain FD-172 SS1) TaxID=930990 RepID=A0A067MXD8_BOTB1|nr:hypothetical protein BOTBODRAFT_27695 [Botryobasidium botryosum FD-172 SS1]